MCSRDRRKGRCSCSQSHSPQYSTCDRGSQPTNSPPDVFHTAKQKRTRTDSPGVGDDSSQQTRAFDNIVTFIIQCLEDNVYRNRIAWRDWYSETEHIGRMTCGRGVATSGVLCSSSTKEGMLTLEARLQALDRVLDALSECLGTQKPRTKLSLEYAETMYVAPTLVL